MQTREFNVPGFDAPVLVHRNDDWTGEVTIEWTDTRNQVHQVVRIPAQLILWISFKETKAWMLDEVGRFLANIKGGLDG